MTELEPAAEVDYYNKNVINEIIAQYFLLSNPEQEVIITRDDIERVKSLIPPNTRVRIESNFDAIRLSVKEATEEELKYPEVMFIEKSSRFNIADALGDLVPHG